jgi:hypothetical protein
MVMAKNMALEVKNETDEDFEDPKKYAKAIAAVKKRCDAASIGYGEVEGWDENFPELHLFMPSGREKFNLRIVSLKEASALLSMPFEEFKFLGEYTGFYNYKSKYIEAALAPVSPAIGQLLMRDLVKKKNKKGDYVDDPIMLESPIDNDSIKIIIDEPSNTYMKLQNIIVRRRCFLTIRVENAETERHIDTIRLIEKIANSVCFQLSLLLGIKLNLQREQRIRGRIRKQKKGTKTDICFPLREYDQQPMSLFWYAKGASNLPLLQYLAFYQILEFYMPTYTNKDAISKIKNILKDPRFNIEKDAQVAKIIKTLSPAAHGFGSERSQLEAVIRECVDPKGLIELISSHKDLKEYYSEEYKSIAPQKVVLNNKKLPELISQIANRIYEIRCRIVHTKDSPAEHDLPPLLPFSKEIPLLHNDIEILEHIVISVLICSSHEFKL